MLKNEKNFDLTVILNAHDETVMAGPTIKSIERAAEIAQEDGIKVELLIIHDSPTEESRAYFNSEHLSKWKKYEVNVRDLGLARNEGVKICKGKYIAFVDADNIISDNWLKKGYHELRKRTEMGERCIAHTQLDWIFDAHRGVVIRVDQDDILFNYLFFSFMNYYDALCMAPRQAFEEVPFLKRDKQKGYGYEDWAFNIQTIAKGWKHIVIKDTFTFMRRKDVSLLSDLKIEKSLIWPLKELEIEKIREKLNIY